MKALRDDLHVLTGSYALDTLPDAEREEFEHHLRQCPPCDAEVRGLRETAARLAMARAVEPPPRMEQRVLAATYRIRQLPPLADRHSRERRRARMARLTRGGPPGRDRRRVRAPRWAAALAAAAVAAAVGLGITQDVTQHQLQAARTSGAAIARVLAAPDARLRTMGTTAGGTVAVVVSFGQRAAVVTTAGMDLLPAARVYQVWVMSPSGARSAGLLARTDPAGSLLASSVAPEDRIGITVEPAGGTSRPTTTPVVVMPLSA